VLHELGHALGLGGGSDPTSPMYEILAAGTAARVGTVADLNIPDSPAGADPQSAAGFTGPPAAVTSGRNDTAAALAATSGFVTIGLSPLTSLQAGVSTQPVVGNGQSTVVGSWVSLRAEVESPLVIQGADRGDELASRPWIGSEVVAFFSILNGPRSSTEPAVDPSAGSERPVRASGVYRADQPFDSSDIIPSHRAVDSVLEELASESRVGNAALGMLTVGDELGNWTILWKAGEAAQTAAEPVERHTEFHPAPETQTDMQTGPPRGSRRGAFSSRRNRRICYSKQACTESGLQSSRPRL
jgi:hypothetical protein